jgi:thiol:disulfide interchange protein
LQSGAAAPSLGHATLPLLIFALCAAVWFTYWREVPELAMPIPHTPADPALAAGADKPALLFFTSDADATCRDFKRDVFDDSDVQAYLKANFVPIIIDVSKTAAPAAADRTSLPRLVLLDPAGHETRRGATMGKASFLQWLQSAHNGQATLVSR